MDMDNLWKQTILKKFDYNSDLEEQFLIWGETPFLGTFQLCCTRNKLTIRRGRVC